MKTKLSRDDIIKLAEQAGYGIAHYSRPPKDGVTVNEWDKHIWGGPMETAKLEHFTFLVLQHASTD